MKAIIDRTNQLLSSPLKGAPRALLLAAATLLVLAWFLPLWEVSTAAARTTREGGSHDYELVEEGQRVEATDPSSPVTGPRQAPADFDEFKWVRFALGVLGLLFLRAVLLGRVRTLVDLFVVSTYFAIFALGSFQLRFSGFAGSGPGTGAYALLAVLAVLGLALVVGWKQTSSDLAGETRMAGY